KQRVGDGHAITRERGDSFRRRHFAWQNRRNGACVHAGLGSPIIAALAKTFAIEFTYCFRRQEALRRYFFRPSISRMLVKALAELSRPWCLTLASPRVYFRGKMTQSGSGSERTAAMRTRKKALSLLAVLFTAVGLPNVVGAQTIPNGAAIDAEVRRI